MSKQIRVTLNEKPWCIRWVNRLGKANEMLDGYCNYDKRVVQIRRGQSERDEFESIIHECIHGGLQFVEEEFVERMGKELTAILYDKLGYRREV